VVRQGGEGGVWQLELTGFTTPSFAARHGETFAYQLVVSVAPATARAPEVVDAMEDGARRRDDRGRDARAPGPDRTPIGYGDARPGAAPSAIGSLAAVVMRNVVEGNRS
jgi:hypothetical protein